MIERVRRGWQLAAGCGGERLWLADLGPQSRSGPQRCGVEMYVRKRPKRSQVGISFFVAAPHPHCWDCEPNNFGGESAMYSSIRRGSTQMDVKGKTQCTT